MAEQRQPFRFRLPWLPTPATPRPTPPAPRPTPPAPRPTSETRAPRPTVETQTPTQPTTAVPIQQPPFRPPGIAPAQPPPQAQAPPRTESPPASPSQAATEIQARSEPTTPASPSRLATESRVTSQPASPSRTATPSRAASAPQSPSGTTPQPQTSPKPTSPTRMTTQVQPTAGEVDLPTSPSKKLQLTAQDSSQLPPSSTQPAVSQPLSEVPELETGITSEVVSKSRDQTPTKTTSQPDVVAAQPSAVLGPVTAAAPPETPAPPQISDSSIMVSSDKPLPESEEKVEETKEVKDVVQEPKKEEKINGSVYKEPKQRTVTELPSLAPGSKTQSREQISTLFQTEQKQVEKQEILERKETLTTSASTGKPSRTVISIHPKDKNTVSESRPRPATITGERAPLHKEVREDISKFMHKLGTQLPDETPVSVITVSGENRGATMYVGSETTKKEGSIHIRRGYKINPDESAETATDGEESFKRRSKDPMTKEDLATNAYVNSNAQSINNSIMLNSSITERNPGVQLAVSRNPTESIRSSGTLDTRKTEYNITPAEKLTHEPTVRRRCLRGLFIEPSDSDPDNPEKPRRHGCRYNGCEKGKDEEKGVL